MKRNICKRLSVLLMLVMVLTLLPAPAAQAKEVSDYKGKNVSIRQYFHLFRRFQ